MPFYIVKYKYNEYENPIIFTCERPRGGPQQSKDGLRAGKIDSIGKDELFCVQ